MTKHRIYSISVASVYPHYVTKAEKKGRTRAEVDEIICWLTGHSPESLGEQLAKNTSFEDFFAQAPRMNPSRSSIKGVVCGIRVEDIQEPLRMTSIPVSKWGNSSAIRLPKAVMDELGLKPGARVGGLSS